MPPTAYTEEVTLSEPEKNTKPLSENRATVLKREGPELVSKIEVGEFFLQRLLSYGIIQDEKYEQLKVHKNLLSV